MSKTIMGGHGEIASSPESKGIEKSLRNSVHKIRCLISNKFVILKTDKLNNKIGSIYDPIENKVIKSYSNRGNKNAREKFDEWILLNPSIEISEDETASDFIDNFRKPFINEIFYFEKGGPNSELKYTHPEDYSACQPDGGFFCIKLNNKLIPIVASETKHQGLDGNAIERFFDNNIWARDVNPDISYLTFASGEGAKEGEVIHKTLHKRHYGTYGGFNKYFQGKNSCFMSVDGFTEEFIYDILVKSIDERCKFYGL